MTHPMEGTPMKKDPREARAAFYASRAPEVRLATVHHVQVRAATDTGGTDGLMFSGYASMTGAGYEVDDFLGSYTEIIRSGSFLKSLAEKDDVRLLVNHDGIPLARTKSGTLTLREITDPSEDPQGAGQTGLWCEAQLDGASPTAQSVRSAMSRGDMDQMSFAFSATRQEWSPDYTQRTITEVKLFDVSVVTYPASPTTSASLRSGMTDAEEALTRNVRSISPADFSIISQALGQMSAIDSIVDEAQEMLAAHLNVPNPDADDAPEMNSAAVLAEVRRLHAEDLAEVDRRRKSA